MQGPHSNVAARTPSSGSADAKPRFNLSASSIIPVDGCPSDFQVEFTINAATGQLARTPVDIVCVVDESYSMSSAASLNDDDDDASGTDEDAGLSISDIVRHAVKTVISVMGPEDRLALVGFSAGARRVMGLTTMDPAGIAAAMTGADDLGPKNNTNLWAGIKEGLDVLHESVTSSSSAVDVDRKSSWLSKTKKTKNPAAAATAPQRLRTILLLTDGEPNVEPQGGHLAALGEYFRTHPGLDSVTTINTFGFGYSLDSKLLKQLSVRGAGMYSFIPDASFVGTAFVNTLSNIRTTAATGATLELTGVIAVEWLGEGGASSSATALKRAGTAASASPSETPAMAAEAAASIEERVQAAVDQAERDKEGQGKAGAIRFGSIQCQQPRHLIARITAADGTAGLTATLRCNAWDRACPESFTIAVDPIAAAASASNHACMRQGASSASFAAQSARLRFVDAINEATALFRQRRVAAAQAAMKDFVDGTANANGDEYVAAVLADATGQATQALSQEAWFSRWGKHYLPSLAQAHLQQQCNNFKDPGVQLYGGAMFEQARDEADDAFLSLPPPKPSNGRRGRGATSSSASAAKVSMSRYHCASNGCFHGASVITMADGAAKRVDQLRKGDSVATPAGPATVGCVVESLCANGAAELVALGDGLLITPYHPVRGGAAGEWRFPHTMALRVSVACAAVYNVVLDRGHEVAINGVQCVTLAHGFADSAVIRHPFFGTDRVTSALKQLPGWDNGWVRIQPSSLLRSRSTGRVIGYADNAAMPPTHIHPSIIQLGLRYSEGHVSGSTARCIAMLHAFKEVITDFVTPPGKDMSRVFTTIGLSPCISFLAESRHNADSMGNAIKYLKHEITKIEDDVSEDETKARLIEVIDKFIQERIVLAQRVISESIRTKIQDDDVILIHGCSKLMETILKDAFDEGMRFRVIMVDSRPKANGVKGLADLVALGIKVTYVLINSISYVMKEATKVFLTAHALLANGYVMSRIGSSVISMMARAYNVPVLVVCETYKFSERVQTDSFVYNELGDPAELATTGCRRLDGWEERDSLKLLNLVYDVTPSEFVDMVVTDIGMVPCTSVPVVLRVKGQIFQ